MKEVNLSDRLFSELSPFSVFAENTRNSENRICRSSFSVFALFSDFAENGRMPKKGPQLFLPADLVPWPDVDWLKPSRDGKAWLQRGPKKTPVGLVDAMRFSTNRPPWGRTRPGDPTLYVSVLRHSSPGLRATLEEMGRSYVDPRGRLHLVAPDLFIHVERPRSKGAIDRASSRPRLGPAAQRVAMTCALEPGDLTVSGLSHRAQASFAQTHQTLTQLEKAGLIRRDGRGPQTKRTLSTRSGVAEFLLAGVDGQRRAPGTGIFVYARTPQDLWNRIGEALGPNAVISGTAAAAILGGPGAGATAVPRTMVRLSPRVPVQEAIRLLDAEPTESGANVSLVTDKARWGEVLPKIDGKARVGNPICVWLDCLSEPRGEEVAQHFRESVLGF